MTKFRSSSTTNYSHIMEHNDVEYELPYEVQDYLDVHIDEVGPYLVVSYLADDEGNWTDNPFTDSGEFEWKSLGRYANADGATIDALDDKWYDEHDEDGTGDEEPPTWTDEQLFEEFKFGSDDEIRYGFWLNDGGSQSFCDQITDGDDLSRVNHVLTVPKDYVTEEIPIEKVDALVDAITEEYLNWARGEVHGLIIVVFKEDEAGDPEIVEEYGEETWGYIGSGYAEESLKGLHKVTVDFLKSKLTEGGE